MPQHIIYEKTVGGNCFRFVWHQKLDGLDIRAFVDTHSDFSPAFGRGFGACILVKRCKSSYSLGPDFMPDLERSLPQRWRFDDAPSIPQHKLEILDSRGYHTERTVLVSHEGRQYVAKGHAHRGDAKADRLCDEWRVMSRLQHPHIAKPYSLVTKGNNSVTAFLIEYQPNGNLEEYIIAQQEKQDRRLDLLYKWPKQLASAMGYLCHSAVKYRNTKLKNCLVDGNENLLMIDFDRLRNSESIPPESEDEWFYIREPGAEKATVYRYGMMVKTLWETTLDNRSPSARKSFTTASDLVDQHYRDFIMKCIDVDPNKRPSFEAAELLFEKKNWITTTASHAHLGQSHNPLKRKAQTDSMLNGSYATDGGIKRSL